MKLISFIVIVLALQCCSTSKNRSNPTGVNDKDLVLDFSAGPPLIIYKMKKDYSRNVAVILSEDKTKIVSYPDPTDIFYHGELAYPAKLDNDYLLDNFGINVNVAYLSITLDEYSNYKDVPTLTEMYKLIIDKDPLTELYFCGNRNNLNNEIDDINDIINGGHLKECKCLTKE